MDFSDIYGSHFQLKNLWKRRHLPFSPKVKKKLKASDSHGRWIFCLRYSNIFLLQLYRKNKERTLRGKYLRELFPWKAVKRALMQVRLAGVPI